MQAKLKAVPKYSLGPFALKPVPFEFEVPAPPKGTIGLHVYDLSEELARALGAVDGKALDVSYVSRRSPARNAGVRRGDIIVELGGKPASDAEAFKRSVRAMTPGTKVKVVYLRDGKRGEVEMTVEGER